MIIKDMINKTNFDGKKVFIYATYGCVWPGDAVDRVMKMIRRNGGRVVGAIVIPMSHSYNFLLDRKLIRELSDADLRIIHEFLDKVLKSNVELKNFSGIKTRFISTLLSPIATPKLIPKPIIDYDKCTKCYACVRVCPTEAININADGYPEINYSRCMRCYLCIRSCKFDAIRVRRTLINFLIRFGKALFRDDEKVKIKMS